MRKVKIDSKGVLVNTENNKDIICPAISHEMCIDVCRSDCAWFSITLDGYTETGKYAQCQNHIIGKLVTGGEK